MPRPEQLECPYGPSDRGNDRRVDGSARICDAAGDDMVATAIPEVERLYEEYL